jgi:RNA polymerase sigma-54 factor
MKPALQLRLSQHLALTPQLQQSIRLLQLSTVELEQEIESILIENPLLERDDGEGTPEAAEAGEATYIETTTEAPSLQAAEVPDFSDTSASGEAGEPAADAGHEEPAAREADIERDFADASEWNEDSAGSYSSAGAQDDDDYDPQEHQSAGTSLREHLLAQLGLTPLSDRDRILVRFLIEALDENGYLTQPIEELAEQVPTDFELEPEDLRIALQHLQHLDPTGVGARNARECLLLQTLALPEEPVRNLAVRVIRDHLDLLANRDFIKLRKATQASDEALREAQALIRRLNPRPGSAFGQSDTRYVMPDVIVRKLRGKWTVTTNGDAFPRLRINRLYAEILSRQRRGENPLSGHLQEARWLIKNVQQRFDTIQRVSQAIVDRQRQFLEHGEVAMRPLVLREIAEVCDLHESTISRVTTQKYMATPRGIFELKYFFGSHVATEAGGACSATAIRALIKQLLAAENVKKPLSDNQIADILGQQGIVVARRTIAKYRESLNIPAANLRKSL